MREPTTDNQEVLFVAINNGSVSLTDFPHLSGYRTRVSQLRKDYGVQFKDEPLIGTNKRGRKFIYQNHILIDIEEAKSQYNLMTRIKQKN